MCQHGLLMEHNAVIVSIRPKRRVPADTSWILSRCDLAGIRPEHAAALGALAGRQRAGGSVAAAQIQ
jgi:hypothetical protein